MASTERDKILDNMMASAPSGLTELPTTVVLELQHLTAGLHAACRQAGQDELTRFERISGTASLLGRGAALPHALLTQWLGGKRVLVTGGTGCIGSELIRQLRTYKPARIICVSRGRTTHTPINGVEYVVADVRDTAALERVFAATRPEVVFHAAAQRDPGLAETLVLETVTTNVFGTANVIKTAGRYRVADFIYAGTGKVLRPFTPDIYAGSKIVAECMMAMAATRSDMRMSAVRFTHVGNNSLIRQRIERWLTDGSLIRLHGPEILFFNQSAREAAQLLLMAGLEAELGRLSVQAVTDLEMPINLLNMTLGIMDRSGKMSPIYFSGYPLGYEERSFPGLYPPSLAGEAGQMFSGLEAACVEPSPGCPEFDRFIAQTGQSPAVQCGLNELRCACTGATDPDQIRKLLQALVWQVLDARLMHAPVSAIKATIKLARQYEAHDGLTEDELKVVTAMEEAVRTR